MTPLTAALIFGPLFLGVGVFILVVWLRFRPDFEHLGVKVRYHKDAFRSPLWDRQVRQMLWSSIRGGTDFEYEPGKKWSEADVTRALVGLQLIIYPSTYILQSKKAAPVKVPTYAGLYEDEDVLFSKRPTVHVVQRIHTKTGNVGDPGITAMSHEVGVHRFPAMLLGFDNAGHDPKFDVIPIRIRASYSAAKVYL